MGILGRFWKQCLSAGVCGSAEDPAQAANAAQGNSLFTDLLLLCTPSPRPVFTPGFKQEAQPDLSLLPGGKIAKGLHRERI